LPKGGKKTLGQERSFTLLEALFTVVILALVMAAIVPFVRTVQRAWNFGDRRTEIIQNARVGMELISRGIKITRRITKIPPSGSGDFGEFRNEDESMVLVAYHNIPASAYYIGNVGFIQDNDLVVRLKDAYGNTLGDVLVAKSLTDFRLDFFQDKGAGIFATAPYEVNVIDIYMNLSDPQGLITETMDISSSVSLRPQVRLNKPVWLANSGNVGELSMGVWVNGVLNPSSVSVNSSTGECWVADTGNNTIKKISPTGEVVFEVPGFNQPYSVSVNPSTGECWVADTANHRVKKISPTDGQVLLDLGGFNQPYSVSVNSTTGEVWVADTINLKIKKLSENGVLLKEKTYSWGEHFFLPFWLSVNSATGDCWAMCPWCTTEGGTGTGVVKRLNSDAVEELSLEAGDGTPFNTPLSISGSTPDNSLWVADLLNYRIVKFSSTGETLLATSQGAYVPLSLSADSSDGSVWVADAAGAAVKLDPEGNEEFKVLGITVDVFSPGNISSSP